MKKRVLKLIISAAVLLFSYMLVARTMSVKRINGINALWDYRLQPENSIDILFMGTSQSGYDIDVAGLWKKYGISSYNLWGTSLPFEVNYYYLVEALKTQQPKLLVLDVYAAHYSYYDYYPRNSSTGGLISNINQIGWNKNRIGAINIAVDKESRVDYFLALPLFHDRYCALEKKDFLHYPWDKSKAVLKGSDYLYTVEKGFNLGDPIGVTEIGKIDSFTEMGLNLIIKYCKEKKIPLLLIKTPSGNRYKEKKLYNRIKQIADINGIPFINFNLMDVGITSYDVADSGGHLNAHGSRKIGSYLADYLAAHYDLPDHRGDPRYASWDAFVKNTQTEWLQNEWELSEWFRLVKDSGESVLLVKNGKEHMSYECGESDESLNIYKDNNSNGRGYSLETERILKENQLAVMLSETLDIPDEELKNKGYAVWVSENPKAESFVDRYAGGLSLETFINGEKFYFDFTNELNFVYKDQGMEIVQDPDWLAVVYDQESGETMDVITINAETGDFSHLPAELRLNEF